MKVDGGCHCGNIRYEAEVDPAKVVICHCTDCQTLSGSAFRTVVPTNEGTFKLLSGAPKVYVKAAENGNRREQTFCPDCGTPIYSAPVGVGPKVVGLRVGTVRQRDQLIPSDQFWFRSSQAWLQRLPTVKKREKQPVFDAKGGFGDRQQLMDPRPDNGSNWHPAAQGMCGPSAHSRGAVPVPLIDACIEPTLDSTPDITRKLARMTAATSP